MADFDLKAHALRNFAPRYEAMRQQHADAEQLAVLGLKKCSRCKETKPIEEFGRDRSTFDGRNRKCTVCNRAVALASNHRNPHRHYVYSLKRFYGLSEEAFEELFAKQRGRCAICNRRMKRTRHRGQTNRDSVCVDHDHVTNRVRGLLCGTCNVGLGHFKDAPVLLARAIRYLRRASG